MCSYSSVLLLVLVAALATAAQAQSSSGALVQCGPRCVEDCPQVRIPICASDGALRVQFNNVCALHAYNCRNGKDFKFLKVGTCYV